MTYILLHFASQTLYLCDSHCSLSKRSKLDKSLVCGKVVDLSNEAKKDQGPEKSIKFRGTIMTDGIGISIVKQNFDITKDSTAKEKKVYRYTQNQKAKELKSTKFRKLHQRFKPTSIQEKKFGNDCILILGNWSAGHAKFQEPIRGVQVYLLDEYKTSSICPSCDQRFETFKDCINLRPYQRSKNPTVKCHGLLRCKNQQCLVDYKALTEEDTKCRLWNRDLAAESLCDDSLKLIENFLKFKTASVIALVLTFFNKVSKARFRTFDQKTSFSFFLGNTNVPNGWRFSVKKRV
ncbi:hypothetical protein EDC94DRAFT_649047 [Helicostylum pulchrum]|nr:hypothetical protein EDC94DRAFT_649047 [Helicostylum pulchrum]